MNNVEELNQTSPTAPTVDEATNQIVKLQTNYTTFVISKVTQQGTRLTKQLNIDGSWVTASLIYDAVIETVKFILSDFADGLEAGVGKDVAFLLGVPVNAPCRLISSDNKDKGFEGITRTNGIFQNSFLPSLMLVDIDFKQCPGHLHNEKEPIEILQTVGAK